MRPINCWDDGDRFDKDGLREALVAEARESAGDAKERVVPGTASHVIPFRLRADGRHPYGGDRRSGLDATEPCVAARALVGVGAYVLPLKHGSKDPWSGKGVYDSRLNAENSDGAGDGAAVVLDIADSADGRAGRS